MEVAATGKQSKVLAVLLSLLLAWTLSPAAAHADEIADESTAVTEEAEAAASDQTESMDLAEEPAGPAEPEQPTEPEQPAEPDEPELTSIEGAAVTGLSTVRYTGKKIEPTVKVVLDGVVLKKGLDYEVAYKDNKKPGKATVIITGIGAYEGEITKTFKIMANKLVLQSSAKVTKTPSWLTTDDNAALGQPDKLCSLTRIKIKRTGAEDLKGSVSYSVYMRNKGWSSAKDGAVAGNGKASNAIQALKVKLTGDLAKKYNVYYRVYVTGYGWTGWGKNNAKVGAPKMADLRAYQVKMVAKGKSFSGSSKNALLENNYDNRYKLATAAKAQTETSRTSWLIMVNTSANRVVIFKGKKGDWKVNRMFTCTSGAPGSPTVHGRFTVGSRGMAFGSGFTCWYWTQFHGNYLFHSVLYNPGSMSSIQDGRLGINASHGCVRLAIGNAKWIYSNIPSGTRVYSY